MNRLALCGVIFCTIASLFFSSSEAIANDSVVLDYRIPAARMAFGSSYELEQCPTADSELRVRVTTAIVPKYIAGDTITLDASGGFLVKRSITLEYFENGTLKSVNAATEGQGGTFVASAIKAAAALPAIGVFDAGDQLRDQPLNCLPHIEAQVQSVAATRAQIAQWEAALTASPNNTALAAQIEQARALLANQRARLTLAARPVVHMPPSSASEGADLNRPYLWRSALQAPNFTDWFGPTKDLKTKLADAGVVGSDGFNITVQGPQPAGAVAPKGLIRSLWYRQPVPFIAEIGRKKADFVCNLTPAACAAAYADWTAAARKTSILVPQAGPARSIRYTGSGIFGNRSIEATFRENGTLAKIGYSSAGGSAQAATVLDASVGAATSLRDLEGQRLARELANEQNRQALEALLDQEAANDGDGN